MKLIHRKKIILAFLLVFTKCSLLGQVPQLHVPDPQSFKSWLLHSWLKESIVYDDLEIVDKKIVLTLTLVCNDNCVARYNHLKSSFDSLSSLSFEDYLWGKARFHLDVSPDDFIVELYNRPQPLELPCFLRAIQMKDTLNVVKVNCKDLGGESDLKYERFNPQFLMKKMDVPKLDKRYAQIVDSLYSKAERYYQSKGKDVLVILNKKRSHSVKFTVRNLSNEVIPGRKTIEKIEITILIILHSDHATFETNMNGKYGSWRFKPTNDKSLNDMEEDHSAEFQLYVDEFTNNRITQWLK